jgi:serine/threonine protein kinase
MGEVYRATDTRLGSMGCDEVLKGPHSERFEQEARAFAALNHPHICTLYDVGPDYLVMEYVAGTALSGPLPVEEALRLALQMTAALEVAHAKGITHRDLKPANIVVTEEDVKLLGWRRSRRPRTRPSLTLWLERFPAPPLTCRRNKPRASRPKARSDVSPLERCCTRWID